MCSTSELTDEDRSEMIRLVLAGELSDEYLSDSDLIELQEVLMDRLLDKALDDGKMVFDGIVGGGLLN